MSMLKEVELSANEREFIPEALKQGVRLDGRRVDQFRELDLSFGEEYGNATVRLGNTV
jgi:exosome complex component RRP45